MSAFQVQDTTINAALEGLNILARDRSWPRRDLAALGYTDEHGCFDTLGQAMAELNLEAVKSRYPDYPHNNSAIYQHHFVSVSLVQSYKSLQCWLYQCSEGTVPESPVFQFFHEKVKPALADKIISGLPEYDKATWD